MTLAMRTTDLQTLEFAPSFQHFLGAIHSIKDSQFDQCKKKGALERVDLGCKLIPTATSSNYVVERVKFHELARTKGALLTNGLKHGLFCIANQYRPFARTTATNTKRVREWICE